MLNKKISSSDAERIERQFLFAHNLSRHLSSVAREFKRQLKLRTSDAGYDGLKLSFSQVLFFLPPSGARLGDLAAINNISKQAISKTVNELESSGYVERVGDDADSRAKKIVLTTKGLQLIADASTHLTAVDREFAVILGEKRFTELKILVSGLFNQLNLVTPSIVQHTEAIPRGAGNFGLQVSEIADEFHRRIGRISIRKGYGGMKISFGQVFSHLGLDGARIVELAKINDVSKQAIGKIADEIEAQGYIVKVPDPEDGRSNKLVLSDRGHQLVKDSVETIGEVEEQLRNLIGEDKLSQFKQLMVDLYDGLGLSLVASMPPSQFLKPSKEKSFSSAGSGESAEARILAYGFASLCFEQELTPLGERVFDRNNQLLSFKQNFIAELSRMQLTVDNVEEFKKNFSADNTKQLREMLSQLFNTN